LYTELDNNWETVVNFWKKWITKKEFDDYLLSNK
jgi:hypothetical protein